MASAPQVQFDALLIGKPGWATESYQFSHVGGRELNFGTGDEPQILIAPAGVNRLTLQERRCGDVYAEIGGYKLCKCLTGSEAIATVAALFEQVAA